MDTNERTSSSRTYLYGLSLTALGVVFGDIGTSPLYALRECFHGSHAIPLTSTNILGVLSLIVWSLIGIVSLKYLLFVMRANNRGEGGILALLALLVPRKPLASNDRRIIFVYFGLFGAALLYGDGIITPAISVLSAVEGLRIATPFFQPYIIPLTVIILFGLFFFQKHGTARLGKIFGPIIFLWFITLALLGLRGIFLSPQVWAAINPLYAFNFLQQSNWHIIFLTLGSVFLVVTGAEALYADMGHFGRKPIQLAWFYIAFPGLLLNYFGQGALLLSDPTTAENPFYRLAPHWAIIPLVVLATCATVIASQALITGAFSLTNQAVQLGYLPRLRVTHTSSREIGQIYIPRINQLLCIGTIFLVLFFRSSSNLAAAYGIAVSTTMVITTILTYYVASAKWRWNKWLVIPLCAVFLFIDICFLSANLLKFAHGGWFPILVAVVMFTVMTTWYRGRQILGSRLQGQTSPLSEFLHEVKTSNSIRVPGTGIFMTRSIDRAPTALVRNVKHNKIIHKNTIFLIVLTEETPHVSAADRIRVDILEPGFSCITVRYGFMESPDIPEVLKAYQLNYPLDDPEDITFFLGKETLIPSNAPGMAIWREKLFALMSANSQQATSFFKIPSDKVIEIGLQIRL